MYSRKALVPVLTLKIIHTFCGVYNVIMGVYITAQQCHIKYMKDESTNSTSTKFDYRVQRSGTRVQITITVYVVYKVQNTKVISDT